MQGTRDENCFRTGKCCQHHRNRVNAIQRWSLLGCDSKELIGLYCHLLLNAYEETGMTAYISPFMKLQGDIIETSRDKNQSLVETLIDMQGDKVFKQIFMITNTSLEGYIAQSRVQASGSFKAAIFAGLAGFSLIVYSVVHATQFSGGDVSSLDIDWISGVAGVITQFISTIFFYLYNKTLQQVNKFHHDLIKTQQLAVGILAAMQIQDVEKLKSVVNIIDDNQPQDVAVK
jgi:hypothetical protein